jgi:hypothetical protein
MRAILALSLLITLFGSANAATVHQAHQRHAIVRSNIASDPGFGFCLRATWAEPLSGGTVQ